MALPQGTTSSSCLIPQSTTPFSVIPRFRPFKALSRSDMHCLFISDLFTVSLCLVTCKFYNCRDFFFFFKFYLLHFHSRESWGLLLSHCRAKETSSRLVSGPNIPLQGRQRSRVCIPDASWESELDSRGSKGPRSPLESPQVSLGAH